MPEGARHGCPQAIRLPAAPGAGVGRSQATDGALAESNPIQSCFVTAAVLHSGRRAGRRRAFRYALA